MNMKECLSKSDVIGSIRYQLRHPSGDSKVWVIVEGETDQKLFMKLIDGDSVEVEISHGGLSSLLDIVSVLLKETNRILGIRDADFLHLDAKNEIAKNIFLTDFHDVELMIISCDNAYLAVVAEYLNRENDPLSLRDKILKSNAFIGGLRWINNTDSLELNFQGLRFGSFYNGKTVVLDEEKCLQVILERSPNKKKKISKEEILLKINNVSDFFNLCTGHDFQKAFALCVNSNSRKCVSDVDIGKAFRLAYGFEDFKKSKLYRQLKEWANSQSMSLFKLS